jgi:hypothetical protein
MALVTRARCSFRGEDAASVNSPSYWRDCDIRAEPMASSAAWGHRLHFAKTLLGGRNQPRPESE